MTAFFTRILIPALGALVLSACNSNTTSPGSGNFSDTGNTTNTSAGGVSGMVADGPLQGVTVCLDKNDNQLCDADEPSALTDAGGRYTLKLVTAADAAAYPVAAYVPVGAVDLDTPSTPVSKPYFLFAPAGGYAFISPITTMAAVVQKNHPDATPSEIATELALRMGLGSTVDLSGDYTQANATPDQQRLHNIARYIANEYLANNLALLKGHFSDNQAGVVNRLLAENAFRNLSDFSPYMSSNTIGSPYTYPISTDMLADLLSISSHTLSAPVQARDFFSQPGGVFIPLSYTLTECARVGLPTGCTIPHANSLRYMDVDNAPVSKIAEHYYDLGSGNDTPAAPEDAYLSQYLTATGWANTAPPHHRSSVIRAYDLSGLGIQPTVWHVSNTLIGNSLQSLNFMRYRTANFPTGATAYIVHTLAAEQTEYWLPDQFNQNLTFDPWLPQQSDDSTVSLASLDEFVFFFTNHDLELRSHSYIWTNTSGVVQKTSRTERVLARLQADGSLRLTFVVHDTATGQENVTALANGAWSIQTIQGQPLLLIHTPGILGDDRITQTFYTVYQGRVTRGYAIYHFPAQDMFEMNATAFNAFKAAIKLSNEP